MVTAARILPNPLYATSPKDYMEYDELMTKMETEASKMHQMVNDLNDQRIRLSQYSNPCLQIQNMTTYEKKAMKQSKNETLG